MPFIILFQDLEEYNMIMNRNHLKLTCNSEKLSFLQLWCAH
jgi:hypothetical protein